MVLRWPRHLLVPPAPTERLPPPGKDAHPQVSEKAPRPQWPVRPGCASRSRARGARGGRGKHAHAHGDSQPPAVSDTACFVPTHRTWPWVSGALMGRTAQGSTPRGHYSPRQATHATRMSSCMPLGPEVTLLPALAWVTQSPAQVATGHDSTVPAHLWPLSARQLPPVSTQWPHTEATVGGLEAALSSEGKRLLPPQPRPPHTRQVTRQRAWGQQSEERNLDHPLSQCNPSPLRRNPRPAGDSGACSAPGHDCAHGLPTQGCSA